MADDVGDGFRFPRRLRCGTLTTITRDSTGTLFQFFRPLKLFAYTPYKRMARAGTLCVFPVRQMWVCLQRLSDNRSPLFAVSSPSMTCCARSGWSRLRRERIESASLGIELVAPSLFLPRPISPCLWLAGISSRHTLRTPSACAWALPFTTCDYARPFKRLKGTGIHA